MVDDDRIGDHQVERSLGSSRTRALPHPVANNFAAAERDLVAVRSKIPLDFDDQLSVGQPDAKLLLLAEGKEAENTVDRLAGIHCMECAQDEVACLSRHQCHFDRGAIAHFADQNDFGRLAERGPQAVGIIVKIVPELPLIEGGALCGVDEFDRVFEGDDVDGLLLVDLIEERRQGCRFAAAGCTRHQH